LDPEHPRRGRNSIWFVDFKIHDPSGSKSSNAGQIAETRTRTRAGVSTVLGSIT
jgi:hypothetical protein